MTDETRKIFYGWWIVAASFLILFITVGLGLYVPPVFLVPLQKHFGWSRAAIAAGGSVAALTTGIMFPLVGIWTDKYGSRKVITIGALVMACAFTLLGLIQSLWHLYALNVLAAIGVACAAWIPNQTLVSTWFRKKSGLAMGIALAGIGFGGLVMAPLADLLIGRLGWRLAYVGLASLVLFIVFPVALLIVRSRPADLGLLPDGETMVAESQRSSPTDILEGDEKLHGLTLRDSVRTNAFWVLALANFFAIFASLSIIGHLVAFLSDVGFESQMAAGSLGLMVGMSVAGRLIFGVLADRIAKKYVMILALTLQAAATLFLFTIQSLGSLPAFVILFGVALGGTAVLVPLLVGECFGLVSFGKILGVIMISATLGAAIGPVLTGRIFDVTGTYRLAFILHVASFITAALIISFLRRPQGTET